MTKRIKPDVEAFARIRVIGVGGSGNNAVNHMVASKVQGVDFIAVNTDAQDLHHSKAKKKVHIGKTLTRGLGTGMNPSLGAQAAEETKEELQEEIKGSDMVFITCGMGGGTGTGAAPVIARLARDMGALTVGVVTKPFAFEGQQRSRFAEEGLSDLRKAVDALIIIPNDKLLAVVDRDTSIKNAFAMCDDILKQAVEGISDLITTEGLINVDFADVRAVMENAGSALMGIGYATGEKRAEEAARAAISSPLLDVSIHGAKGVLFSVAGDSSLGMLEVQDAANIITDAIDTDAKVIFGTITDESLKKGQVRVTVIATGFPENALGGRMNTFFGNTARTTAKEEEKPAEAQEEKKDAKTDEDVDKAVVTETKKEEKKEDKKKDEKKKDEKKDTKPSKKEEDKEDGKKDTPPPFEPSDDDDEWASLPSFLRRMK